MTDAPERFGRDASIAPLRRRELILRAAIAAAAGGLLLGKPPGAAAQGSADVAAILAAVRLEQSLAVAYAAMASRPRLGRDLRDLLAHLADHERQHAAAILTLAEYVGVLPPRVPTLAQVERTLPSVRTATDHRSALVTLEAIERAEVLGFYAIEQVLTDVKLIQLIGAVTCSDSQHLALARQAAGRDPIPSALETGAAR